LFHRVEGKAAFESSRGIRKRIFKESYRVLKDGGSAFFVEANVTNAFSVLTIEDVVRGFAQEIALIGYTDYEVQVPRCLARRSEIQSFMRRSSGKQGFNFRSTGIDEDGFAVCAIK